MSKYLYNMARGKRFQFAQPTVNDVRPVNPVLTNLSIGFKNDKFLWEQLAPVWEVDEQSGTYPTIDREFWFRRQGGAARAANSQYTRVGYGITSATYQTVEYGFEKLLPDVVVESNEYGDNLETLDTQFLTNLMELELEKQSAGAFFVTGVWGTSNTLTGTNQWSDFANSDPIADADTAKNTIRQNTGALPNKMFIGVTAWQKLREHPLILDKYKHTQVGVMTPQLVAAALEIDEIVVGDSVENTGDEGQTFVGADIWTDNCLFLVTNPPGLGVSAAAYSIIWNEKGNVPWAVDSYREDQTRGTVNRIFTHARMNVVSAQHGYLFLDCIA